MSKLKDWTLAWIDLLLYGNFWIALASTALVLQTKLLLFHLKPTIGWLEVFVFSGTLFLYAVHRITGIRQMGRFVKEGRFAVIVRYRTHIQIYALIGAGLSLFAFFQFSRHLQLALLLPALLSLAYVLPLFDQGKRLRDFHYLKIFLIATVFAFVTVLLPVLERSAPLGPSVWFLFAERSCFMLAITLPFDIRDLQVDRHYQVKTLPHWLGIAGTLRMAALLILLMLFFIWSNWTLGTYSNTDALALLLSALSSYALIFFADRREHDYYFSGLLDGTMVLQFLLVFFL